MPSGRRVTTPSEKLDESQYAFAFEEVQTALGEIEVQLDRLEPKNKQKPGGRRPLPAHLERVEEIIEPEETVCACGACARVKIGEDVSERHGARWTLTILQREPKLIL